MHYYLLDIFRGLAALWVFAFHYSFSQSFRETFPFINSFLGQGHLGVPMFFVISGYCITASARSTISKNRSTTSFLWRRFRRIYPTFWFSILVILMLPFCIEFLSFLKHGHYTYPNSASWKFLEFGPLEWLRVFSLTEVFWPHSDAKVLSDKFSSINSPYWSLAVEVQFYLVVTVCMAMSREKFLTNIFIVTLFSFAALIAGLPPTTVSAY